MSDRNYGDRRTAEALEAQPVCGTCGTKHFDSPQGEADCLRAVVAQREFFRFKLGVLTDAVKKHRQASTADRDLYDAAGLPTAAPPEMADMAARVIRAEAAAGKAAEQRDDAANHYRDLRGSIACLLDCLDNLQACQPAGADSYKVVSDRDFAKLNHHIRSLVLTHLPTAAERRRAIEEMNAVPSEWQRLHDRTAEVSLLTAELEKQLDAVEERDRLLVALADLRAAAAVCSNTRQGCPCAHCSAMNRAAAVADRLLARRQPEKAPNAGNA